MFRLIGTSGAAIILFLSTSLFRQLQNHAIYHLKALMCGYLELEGLQCSVALFLPLWKLGFYMKNRPRLNRSGQHCNCCKNLLWYTYILVWVLGAKFKAKYCKNLGNTTYSRVEYLGLDLRLSTAKHLKNTCCIWTKALYALYIQSPKKGYTPLDFLIYVLVCTAQTTWARNKVSTSF